MAVALWLVQPWLVVLPQSLALAVSIALGATLFALLAHLSGAMSMGELKAAVAKR
jgi:hypothetical protein